MSLKKQAASGFLWSFIQQFSMLGVNFGVSIFMARLLLPSEFGLMGMIYVFFTIGNVLLDAGLAQSLIRTQDLDDEDYSTVFYFNILIAVVLYFILFFTAPLVANFYNQPILISLIRVYAIIFIISKSGLLVLSFFWLRSIALIFSLAQFLLSHSIHLERMDHLIGFQNRRLLMVSQQFFRMISLLHQVVDPFDFATTATALA
jgi:O-antigen/teichoic acid export membrane protein